ncbi:MAG: hypothetical protein AAGC55_14975, partial [Myxococcota bacterium]
MPPDDPDDRLFAEKMAELGVMPMHGRKGQRGAVAERSKRTPGSRPAAAQSRPTRSTPPRQGRSDDSAGQGGPGVAQRADKASDQVPGRASEAEVRKRALERAQAQLVELRKELEHERQARQQATAEADKWRERREQLLDQRNRQATELREAQRQLADRDSRCG